MHHLQSLLLFLASSYEPADPQHTHKPLPTPLLNELALRYRLSAVYETPVRSYMLKTDIAIVVKSSTACEAFTRGQLTCDDRVRVPQGSGRVLGIGSNHQLYIRFDGLNELYVTSQASCLQQLQNGSMQRLSNQDEIFDKIILSSADNDQASPRNMQSSTKAWPRPSRRSSHSLIPDLTEEQFLAELTVGNVEGKIQVETNPQWTRDDDSLLSQWITVISYRYSAHPFDLPLHCYLDPAGHLVDIYPYTPIKTAYSEPGLEGFVQSFGTLFAKYTREQLSVRLTLILTVNDYINVLFSLCSPEEQSSTLSPSNHPSGLLLSMKHLVLFAVREECTCRAFVTAPDKLYNKSHLSHLSMLSKPLSYNVRDGSPMLLNLEQPSVILHRIRSATKGHNYEDVGLDNGSSLWTEESVAGQPWALIAGFQASYIGQMYKFLFHLSASSSSVSAASAPSQSDTRTWEGMLRQCNVDRFADRDLPYCLRPVPFIVRFVSNDTEPDADAHLSPAVVSDMMCDDLQLLLRHKVGFGLVDESSVISEWSIFAAFVREALLQVEQLLEMIFDHSQASQEHLIPQQSSACIPYTPFTVETAKALLALSAADIHVLSQVMHATGVLIGLGIRANTPTPIALPQMFIDTLHTSPCSPANPKRASHMQDEDVANILAHALKSGLTSIIPAAALSLYTNRDLTVLLSPGSHVAHALKARAVYPQDLSATELEYIQTFWIAVTELSSDQLDILLNYLEVSSKLPFKIHTICRACSPPVMVPALSIRLMNRNESEPLIYRSADGGGQIVLYKEEDSILLPRLQTADAYYRQLLALVDSI